jgi:hypothetical protein
VGLQTNFSGDLSSEKLGFAERFTAISGKYIDSWKKYLN